MPLGLCYIAQRGGTNHMWKAAQLFATSVVVPYLNGDTVTVTPPLTPAKDSTPAVVASGMNISPLGLVIIAAIVLALCAWWVWSTHQGQQRRKFVRRPPSFQSATDPMMDFYAREALTTAFGRHVQVVDGSIRRGYITGELIMLNRDGTTSRVRFDHEEGWEARVLFPDGHERVVYCRQRCFNPLWGLEDAQFSGTFQPIDSTATPVGIPRISPEQVAAVSRTTRGSDQPLSSADLPGAVEPAPIPTTTPKAEGPLAAVAGTDGTLRLTKMQVFDGGKFTIEGDMPLTVEQLINLAYQLTGRHPLDLEAKKPKPVEPPKPEAVQIDMPVTDAPEPSASPADVNSPTAQ
ncbi:MAG: hypothetical protein V1685_00595 [Parcubacteria group bacterium]